MRRRDFLAGMLVAAVQDAEAQQAGKVYRIGFLGNLLPSTSSPFAPQWRAFIEGLRERGWEEGRNLTIESRWVTGRPERYPEFATELIALNVELIVALGSDGTGAAKNKTRSVPIVMVNPSDPVETGLIASLARPGGNVTGVSSQLDEIIDKQLELLKEIRPNIERIALLWDPGNAGSTRGARVILETIARLGLSSLSLAVSTLTDLDAAFATIARERPQALLGPPVAVLAARWPQIAAFAIEQRLPTITGTKLPVHHGWLMSYGPDFVDQLYRAAGYVDRILKGANPAELPVERPRKFELVVNLKTARAIGVNFPPLFLARADEVIE